MEGFFGNRGSSEIMRETLLGCLKLYGSEILEKGMKQLVDQSDFQNLRVLYSYFEVIGEVDLLKKSVCQVIEVFHKSGVFCSRKKRRFLAVIR